MEEVICQLCVDATGRDTTQQLNCTRCGRFTGCFWHSRLYHKHVAMCKSVNRSEEDDE